MYHVDGTGRKGKESMACQTETSRPPKLVLELSYLVLRRNMLRPSLIPGTISEAACVTVVPVLGL
jgi:hypothetical protein